jgi:hypothetical protein
MIIFFANFLEMKKKSFSILNDIKRTQVVNHVVRKICDLVGVLKFYDSTRR